MRNLLLLWIVVTEVNHAYLIIEKTLGMSSFFVLRLPTWLPLELFNQAGYTIFLYTPWIVRVSYNTGCLVL